MAAHRSDPHPTPHPRDSGTRPRPSAGTDQPHLKIMLVDFRDGEPVDRHPELAEFIGEGWRVRSAVPRLVEGKQTKLFVVLVHPD